MTFLALDTDILLYRSTSAAEKEVDWGGDVWSLWSDLKDAKDAFREQVESIGKKLGVDNVVCALSDSKANYRRPSTPATSRTGEALANQSATQR